VHHFPQPTALLAIPQRLDRSDTCQKTSPTLKRSSLLAASR